MIALSYGYFNPRFIHQELLRAVSRTAANLADVTRYSVPGGDARVKHAFMRNYLNLDLELNHCCSVVSANLGFQCALISLRAEKSPRRIHIISPIYMNYLRLVQHYHPDILQCVPEQDFSEWNWNIPRELVRVGDIVIACQPSNPTGQVWEHGKILHIMKSLRNIGATLVLDIGWYMSQYVEPSFVSLKELVEEAVRQHHVILFPTSKSLGLHGVRCAFVVSTPLRIQNITSHHDAHAVSCGQFDEMMVMTLLKSNQNSVDWPGFRKHLRGNAAWASACLRETGAEVTEPKAGIFLYFRHPSISDPDIFVQRCAEKGVAIYPSSLFGPDTDGARVCLSADSDVLKRGVVIICEILRTKKESSS